MLENHLNQLGHELEMTDLITSSQDHHYDLLFNDHIQIEAIELDKNIMLKGVIGTCPEQNKEAFLLKSTEANLFGIGTREAAIGLTEDEKLLTLSLELEYNQSYKNFKEKLEDFISVLSFWREEISKHQ